MIPKNEQNSNDLACRDNTISSKNVDKNTEWAFLSNEGKENFVRNRNREKENHTK